MTRLGRPFVVRGRRQFVASVPSAETVRLFGAPKGRPARFVCTIEVVPFRNRWEWRVRMGIDGSPDPSLYSEGGWRRPGPSELRGRCREQGKAWRVARAVVNDVRARQAELQVVEMRSHTERVPL